MSRGQCNSQPGTMVFRRLLSGLVESKANIGSGPLLKTLSIPSIKQPILSNALIPRRNPFLKPVQAYLRNFQTFQPEQVLSLSPILFDAPIRRDIMHRVVVWHRAGLRQGTASSKGRGEVAGSTRKVRPQKGTGNARVGSNRAPQRKGGGRCFGPKPRDHYFSLSPKIRALGLRSALSARYKTGHLTCVNPESLAIETYKTANLSKILDNIPVDRKVLLLDTEPLRKNLKLAAQSLTDRFKFMNVTEEKVNAYHVLDSKFVLLTPRAIDYLRPWLEHGQ